MTEKELEIMSFLHEEIDQYLNNKLREAMEKYEPHVVINAMINIGTSTMSKVLLMTRPENRQSVMQTAISVIHDKTKEGDEIIREVRRAMQPTGMPDTCYPDFGTRH
jgi:hypothetical protein